MNPYNFFRYIPLSVLRASARFVAWVIMCLQNLSIHNSVRRNLLITHPDLSNSHLSKSARSKLHRQVIINQCLTSVESVKSWAMPPEWSLEQIKEVHNQDILINGLDNPNGMLAIVPHLGTWEMMNAWLNQQGSPTIMYKPVKGKITNDFVLKGRERLNSTLVPTDATGVKAVFKTLKSGGFSIILPDHTPDPTGGVVVPWFGVEVLSSTLAPKLASKTKCALVGLACIRREDSTGFDIHCHDLNNNDLYSRDMNTATFALNAAMQQMIEPLSEHYMWGYRRFKKIYDIQNLYKLDFDKFLQFIDKRKLHKSLTDIPDSNHRKNEDNKK